MLHSSTTSDIPAAESILAAHVPGDIERATVQIGRELLADGRKHRAGMFSSRFWSDRLMEWAMKDPAFKVQLFRYVDVFPMLHDSGQVHGYLAEYLSQPGVSLSGWMDLGLKAGGLARGLFAATVSNRITALAETFIAGRDAASALPKLAALWNDGVAFSVDLLGEACVSDAEARAYQRRYLGLVETLASQSATWDANPGLESDYLEKTPRANVSVKISSLAARVDPVDFEGSKATLSESLRPILEAARSRNVLINFDMEQYALKDLTLDLFERSCEAIDFPAGIAIQAYLRTSEDDVRRLIAWARRTGRRVTVRLVKGAYWDYEVIHAERTGWPVPVWTAKRETDANFERLTEMLLAAAPRHVDEGGVKLALGSHNVRSIARGLALLHKYDLPESAIELQMLYGMADSLKAAVLDRGLRLRQYVPIGEMLPGMAYLVRRLLENTSNESWLRAGFFDNVPDEDLLASPHASSSLPSETADEAKTGVTRAEKNPVLSTKYSASNTQHSVPSTQCSASDTHQYSVLSTQYSGLAPLSAAVDGLGDGRPFSTEPLRDFAQSEVRRQFAGAIRSARVPEVGRERSAADLDAAIGRAQAAFVRWRDEAPLVRAQALVKAAEAMRQRRDELSGIAIRESGKTWREADADVCEAIDFCEYYARMAVGLFQPQRLGRFVGELNLVWHEPRGVAAVISPWNFPLSICTGMTTASLVTGNTVLVKPSTQTPGIALAMCRILWDAGVPTDVLQFMAGSGRVVGAGLVRDPRVALIAFTGSKEVGLDILAAAAQTSAGQEVLKKVVCEMGGKNAIIVDESADLDEAVLGVRQSAFGYSGQKCSACSRAIVVESVYPVFLERLIESTRSLVIGDPLEPGTDVGPVIDAAAARKISQYIDVGKSEGKLELACEVPAGLDQRVGKPYIGPHIFSGIEPRHRLAQEEIFGPVLSVMRVASFEQALDWANSSTYKLTGGVFSRKPSHLAQARREFRVGNLYLNRGITGALVGRQPFGGFGLSGTGTQAGGPEYLLNFVQPRSVSENTLRHGFAPGLE